MTGQLSICHPDTRSHLKEDLLNLQEVRAALALALGDTPSAGRPELTRNAADGLRQLFPGLDDLTLAAVCAYVANLAAHEFDELPTISSYATLMAHVDMATELAWEFKGEL